MTASSAALRVLIDRDVFRMITLFQRGLPQDIAQRTASLDAQALTNLPQLAVRHKDKLFERLCRLKHEQVEYFRQQPKLQFDGVWIEAVGVGDVAMALRIEALAFIPRANVPVDTIWKRAIQSRVPAMVQYVTQRDPHLKTELTQSHVTLAIEHDATAVLKWLDENIPSVPYSSQPQLLAVDYGAIDVLRYFHERDVPHGWTPRLMDRASQLGNVEITRFLHEHRTECYTVYAMHDAATNGHLEVVRFLYEHRTDRCTRYAMGSAAAAGHLAIVRFFHEKPLECCTTQAMDRAAANGHLEVVRFLHQHRQEGCTIDAMNGAAENGYVAVVRFLHEHRTEGCTKYAMSAAAANGHIAVVRFLHEHRKEGCTSIAINDAVANGHVEVVRFFHEHRKEKCTRQALERATSQNRGDMVAFLLEHRDDIDPATAFELALDRNHMDLVVSMHRHRRWSLDRNMPHVDADDPVWTVVKKMIETDKRQPYRAIEAAARDGNLAVLQILTVHWHRQSTLNACIEAAVQRLERIVAFFVHNCLSATEKRQLLRDAVNRVDLWTVQRVATSCEEPDVVMAHKTASQRGLDDIANYLAEVVALAAAADGA